MVEMDMSVRISSVQLLLICAVVLASGCSTIVREVQHSQSLRAPERLAILDVELNLETYLWIDSATNAKLGRLNGRLIVRDTEGRPVPSELRLYHFQVMRGGFGDTLSNYRLPGEGVSPMPTGERIIFQFYSEDLYTDKPVDVAVSLTDKSFKRHVLLARNQPIHRKPPDDVKAHPEEKIFGLSRVGRRQPQPPLYIYQPARPSK